MRKGPRKSEENVIKNRVLYKQIASKYVQLIEELTQKHKVHKDECFSELVNFKQNKEIPKHSWFIYKQGYSENLVKELIKREKPSKQYYVLDPFAGVGTTNLVAQSMGYKSIGFDINPVATFAAKVKTQHFSDSDFVGIRRQIKNFNPQKSEAVPDSPLLAKAFSKKTFEDLMKIKGFCETISNQKVGEFFWLAYLAIIEDCSNRIKDGNGIKISKNKKTVDDVYGLFLKKASVMLCDLSSSNYAQEALIISGSIKDDFKKIRDKKIGIVIFSPPYANCFDYCEVYKMELWMGDFVRTYGDFKKYRDIAVRSHVNATFDHAIKHRNYKVDVIADTISCFNIWNKNIPDMIRGYFDDMTQVFEKLCAGMVKGAKCFIVVANSGYRGILVPTDLLFADIGQQVGFKVVEIILARKMRASSQQMKELNGKYENLMRESIVVLEKI
jgi:DNA modification methylase